MNLPATQRLIGQARLREATGRGLYALSYALPVGAALTTGGGFLYSFEILSGSGWAILAALTGAVVAVGVVVYALLGVSTWRLARLVDTRADLKDRLTNALEFSVRDARSPLMELAIADAETVAPTVPVKPVAPMWRVDNWRRLGTLALLVPLAYAFAVINLADVFRDKAEPDFLGAVLPTMPAELAEDGFRDLPDTPTLLPALSGFRGAMGHWRQRLTELRERARKLALNKPREEPLLPETIYREDLARGDDKRKQPQILAVDGLPAVRETDRLHLSDARALGDIDGEVDSSMQEAFGQLDSTLLDEDPRLQEVENYLNTLRVASRKGKAAGNLQTMQAGFGMGGVDGSEMGAFRNATQGAQQEIFNEFIAQYAEHLGRMVDAKRDVNAKRAKRAGQPTGQVRVADQGQQIPENAEWRMVKVTDDMRRDVQLSNQMGKQLVPGGNSSKAGQGGGTFRGAIKVKHETAANATKQTIRGQLGEGRTAMQILEDVEGANPQTYDKLLAQYRMDAAERLADPTIPPAIRAYVQRYLASIGPAKP